MHKVEHIKGFKIHYCFACSMCSFGKPQYSDSESDSDSMNFDGLYYGGDPRIYKDFDDIIMKPNEWCEHLMKYHLKDFENNKSCPMKRCNFKYKLLHEAVIHYRTIHGLFYSQCRTCHQRFPSLTGGKDHEKAGCGLYWICGACSEIFYTTEEIEQHKQPNNCSYGAGFSASSDDDYIFTYDEFVRVNNDDE